MLTDVIYQRILKSNNSEKNSRLIDILHSKQDLISQSLATKSNQTPFSCVAYSLDEIYQNAMRLRKTDKIITQNEIDLVYYTKQYDAIKYKINRLTR